VFEFILAEGNLPFTVALGLMLAIAVLEGTMTLLGAGMSEAIDALLPESIGDVDLDADIDMDLDASGALYGSGVDFGDAHIATPNVEAASALSRILGWFCVGKVPVLILFVAFLTLFGLSGLIIQSMINQVTGYMLSGSLASIPALLIAFPLVRYIGLGLAKLIPKDESSAVSSDTFIGHIAKITIGVAEKGKPAEAKLRDRHGQTHYVMVEPDESGAQLSAGTDVLIIAKQGSIFQVIQNHNQALVD